MRWTGIQWIMFINEANKPMEQRFKWWKMRLIQMRMAGPCSCAWGLPLPLPLPINRVHYPPSIPQNKIIHSSFDFLILVWYFYIQRIFGFRCCSSSTAPNAKPKQTQTPELLKIAVTGATEILRLFIPAAPRYARLLSPSLSCFMFCSMSLWWVTKKISLLEELHFEVCYFNILIQNLLLIHTIIILQSNK